jgi:hypothetical protein
MSDLRVAKTITLRFRQNDYGSVFVPISHSIEHHEAKLLLSIENARANTPLWLILARFVKRPVVAAEHRNVPSKRA